MSTPAPDYAVPPPVLYTDASRVARLQAVLAFATAAHARGEGVVLLVCLDSTTWREDLLQAASPAPSRTHVLDYTHPSDAAGYPASAAGMLAWLRAGLAVPPSAPGTRLPEMEWLAMVVTRFARLRRPGTAASPDLLDRLASPVPHKDWWQRTRGTLGAGWRAAVACHAALPHGFHARLSDIRHALGSCPAYPAQASEDLGPWLDAGDTVILRTQARTDGPSAAIPAIHARLAFARLQAALAERDHTTTLRRWSVALLDVPTDLGPTSPTFPAQVRARGVALMQAAPPGEGTESPTPAAAAWRANFVVQEQPA